MQNCRIRLSDPIPHDYAHSGSRETSGRAKSLHPLTWGTFFTCHSQRWHVKNVPHPHELAQSKSSRRFDVSRLLRRAQSVVKVSPSVVRMSWSVDFMSWSVDLLMQPVDFWSRFAPILESTSFDATHDKSSRCGIRNSGSRSKTRLFGSQKPKKHPKKRFWSVRNCDLRRLACSTQ